ncbi:MAG: hypothetical protein H6R19_2695 [Proteobacteria bacterium]|nr:hypothetical protein [Pseudomonadota bacterium]
MTKLNLLWSSLLAGLLASGLGSAQAAPTTFRFASEAPRSDSQFIAGQRFGQHAGRYQWNTWRHD